MTALAIALASLLLCVRALDRSTAWGRPGVGVPRLRACLAWGSACLGLGILACVAWLAAQEVPSLSRAATASFAALQVLTMGTAAGLAGALRR